MSSILIIDDDATIRRDIKRALSGDYTVIEATGPADGLRSARHHRPDLILLDVVMPRTDGISVLRQLREDPTTAGIPVIIVSSLSAASQVAACLEEGAVDHIAKPFSHRELRERVELRLQTCASPVHAASGESGGTLGKIVSFLGVNGGVGTTTLALNVATTWALEKRAIVLAEMRSHSGSLALQLDMEPKNDLGLLLGSSTGLTDIYVKEVLTPQPSGLEIMFSPRCAGVAEELNAARVGPILSSVSRRAEIVVLDLSPELSLLNLEILRLSDIIVLVLERGVSSIRAARWVCEQLRVLAVQRPLCAVIVNRTGLSTTAQVDEIQSTLDCDILSVVPLSGDILQTAARAGRPVVQMATEDSLAITFQEIARQLTARLYTDGATRQLSETYAELRHLSSVAT